MKKQLYEDPQLESQRCQIMEELSNKFWDFRKSKDIPKDLAIEFCDMFDIKYPKEFYKAIFKEKETYWSWEYYIAFIKKGEELSTNREYIDCNIYLKYAFEKVPLSQQEIDERQKEIEEKEAERKAKQFKINKNPFATKIKFGKYKGELVIAIMDLDPQYIEWACDKVDGFKDYIEEIKNKK
jgi:hypothetical protein